MTISISQKLSNKVNIAELFMHMEAKLTASLETHIVVNMIILIKHQSSSAAD